MTTFKAGDLVTCTRYSGGGGFTKGKQYVVREDWELRPGGPLTQRSLLIELDDRGSTTNGWNANYFQLAELKYIPSQEGDRHDDI